MMYRYDLSTETLPMGDSLSMGKLIVLKLEGDLENQGFKVTLEIGHEDNSPTTERLALRPWIELSGYLPANPGLANLLQHHWQKVYRRTNAPNRRLKPHQIVYDRCPSYIQACRQSAEQLRDRTLNWLDADGFRPIDKCLREALDRHQPTRFLIRSDDPQIQKLPWHLWDLVERYPNAEVAFSSTAFQPHCLPRNCDRSPKVRILAILGHSANIDLNADRQFLEHLPNAETVFLVEPTHQHLNDQLWEQPWDILFFAGHSTTEGEIGQIYINETESLTVGKLRYALRQAIDQGLKLAIFNSCDGLGLTRLLADLNIPQTIAMRELIPDRVAQTFLKHFLQAFSSGQPFYLAVREARERLQGLESQFPCASWLPVICQHPTARPLNWEDLYQHCATQTTTPPTHSCNQLGSSLKLYFLPSGKALAMAAIAVFTLIGTIRAVANPRPTTAEFSPARPRLPEAVKHWPGSAYPQTVPLSPEGRSLGAVRDRIQVPTANSSEVTQPGDVREIEAIILSPDSQTIAVVGNDGTVKIWHWQTQTDSQVGFGRLKGTGFASEKAHNGQLAQGD